MKQLFVKAKSRTKLFFFIMLNVDNKEINPNYSIWLPVLGVKVRMGVVEYRLSKCIFVA